MSYDTASTTYPGITGTDGLLDQIPGPLFDDDPNRSVGSTDDQGLASRAALQDLARSVSRAMTMQIGTDGDTGFVTSDGGTVTTVAVQIDMTAGRAVVDGVPGKITALNDFAILGTSAAKCINHDGTTGSLPSANGKTKAAALCIVVISGALDFRVVLGAEADDGAQVAPTITTCRDALAAASISGLREGAGLIVQRFTVARGASTTITLAHGAPSSDAALWAERMGKGAFWAEV